LAAANAEALVAAWFSVGWRVALGGGESIVTTGLILQELLQGFAGPRARKDIVQRFTALPLIVPDRRRLHRRC